MGVVKSTDGGENWREINTGISNEYINDLAIDPFTPTTLFAGTSGGMFMSTDSGENWYDINRGFESLDICTLAIDPLISSTLFARSQLD